MPESGVKASNGDRPSRQRLRARRGMVGIREKRRGTAKYAKYAKRSWGSRRSGISDAKAPRSPRHQGVLGSPAGLAWSGHRPGRLRLPAGSPHSDADERPDGGPLTAVRLRRPRAASPPAGAVGWGRGAGRPGTSARPPTLQQNGGRSDKKNPPTGVTPIGGGRSSVPVTRNRRSVLLIRTRRCPTRCRSFRHRRPKRRSP